jgi:hypothetical protein
VHLDGEELCTSIPCEEQNDADQCDHSQCQWKFPVSAAKARVHEESLAQSQDGSAIPKNLFKN